MASFLSLKSTLLVTSLLVVCQGNLEFKSSVQDSSLSAWEKFAEILQSSIRKPVVDFLSRRKRSNTYDHVGQLGYNINMKNISGIYNTYKAVGPTNDTLAVSVTGKKNDSDTNPQLEPGQVSGTQNENVTTSTFGTEFSTTASPTTLKNVTTDSVNVSTQPVSVTAGANFNGTDKNLTGANITVRTKILTSTTISQIVTTPNTDSTELSTSTPVTDVTTNLDDTLTGVQTTIEPEAGSKRKPTVRPKPEIEVTTESKSESTGSHLEPTTTKRAEPEVFAQTRKPYVEPVPVWYEAKLAWGPAWEFHIYFVGLAFAVVTVYSVVSIIRLWQKKQLLSRGFFIALNAMLATMGLFRSVYFLVDGYNSHEIFSPDAVDYFVYTIGFPCLTSAFSILFLALLQTTKVQLMSPHIQRGRILLVVILAHIILSVTTDVIVGSIASARALMFVCQLVSVMWGILLFAGYFYIFKTLYVAALRRQKDLLKLSLGKLRLPGIKPIHKPPRLTLGLGVKVTLATAITGLLYSALQIYAMVGVYGVFSKSIPAPWPWWGFKFLLRILELVMCFLMSYVATQPFRYQKRPNRTVCDCFCWAPCHAICEGKEYETKEDSIYWNEIHGVSVSYSQELDPSDPSQAVAAKYTGSPDESIPLSSEEDITLHKSRSNTMDSDYGDLDLGSGPIVLNPHVLYQRNPELLSLRDETQNETKLHKHTPIKMPSSIDLEDGPNGETSDDSKFASRGNENMPEQKTDTPNRKPANRPSSLKTFLPRSPMKGNFPFLHSKPAQAGYSNLGDKTDPMKAPPVKRSVSEGASSVRTKSHQGSNYLSLSDIEVNTGVLDTSECKGQGQEMIPTSPTIPEEPEEGKMDQQGNLNV
jgi:hypothetical protein